MTPQDLQTLSTITTQIGQLISESADAGGYIDTGEVFEAFDRWNDALVAILDRHDDGPQQETHPGYLTWERLRRELNEAHATDPGQLRTPVAIDVHRDLMWATDLSTYLPTTGPDWSLILATTDTDPQ